jgi:hypothetical protein
VLEAQGDSPAAQEALEKLCHMYWRPIFDVTGGNFPAAPVQQQDWTNGGDGLWRWMPSLAADQNGNIAIGYSTSSSSIYAGIRYAGRLSSDPLNDLGQGEAIMTNGSGARLTPWVAGATIP